MWTVQNIEFRPAELDFSSSGGRGRHPTIAVFADGLELVNALDLVYFGTESVQLQVCRVCGTTNCAPGGWVSPRRFDDGLLLVPCFLEMIDESDRTISSQSTALSERAPPVCIAKNGPAFLVGAFLEVLGERVQPFRELDRWPRVTASEFTRIMQWRAPTRILGEFPAPPRFRREFVVALDPGDQEETMTAFDDLLALAFECNDPVTRTRGVPVSFFLDLPGFVEWVPMAFDRGTALLANGPDWIVSFPHDA